MLLECRAILHFVEDNQIHLILVKKIISIKDTILSCSCGLSIKYLQSNQSHFSK